MNKPAYYYNMSWEEQRAWQRDEQDRQDAEYDRQRAEQDAEDARLEAQQARQNYQRQAASYAEEESYLIADIENKDAQIEALSEQLAEVQKDAEFMARVWNLLRTRHESLEVSDPDGIQFVADRILAKGK